MIKTMQRYKIISKNASFRSVFLPFLARYFLLLAFFFMFLGIFGAYFAILPPFCHAQRSDYQRVLQNDISCITFKNFM